MAFYPLYQQCLAQLQKPVSVRAIIAEETKHLAAMKEQIAKRFDHADELMTFSEMLENQLYHTWVQSLEKVLFKMP